MIPLTTLMPLVVSALTLSISLMATGHVLLTKRDTRAAIGWIGLIWLSPILGTAVYVLLGINRITRKARSLRRGRTRTSLQAVNVHTFEVLAEAVSPANAHLAPLVQFVERLTTAPLLAGNEIVPLLNGDLAYPAMIQAIDQAQHSVGLSTYIFKDDRAGRLFIDALKRAVERKVKVRVLVDSVGARYKLPTVIGPLRRAGVTVNRFIPTYRPVWFPYFNLRNHRKVLVVDGRIGFTGGMNIDEGDVHQYASSFLISDLHFQVRGPVVAHLQQVFVEDWVFSHGELLQGEDWFPPLDPVGPVLARGIADGPDEDFDKLNETFMGAATCARSSVLIVTPYFLPELPLITALRLAAMRGVRVDILLPKKNNLTLVQWASTAMLDQVLEAGCRVWYTAPPFEHTKLMIVDQAWTIFGSGNWDPRSLRLNFEFNVECYSAALVKTLDALIRSKLDRAEPVTLEQIRGRSLPIKLRDRLASLFSPYL